MGNHDTTCVGGSWSAAVAAVLCAVLVAGSVVALDGVAPDAAAAVFEVTTRVVNPAPGRFTATTGPKRQLIDWPFEPMVWRRRFEVSDDAVGRVYAYRLDHYDSYAAGYWDGAAVRVLRVADGRLRQMCLGRVKRYHRGEWTAFSAKLVPAERPSAEFAMEGWAKPETTWWLSVTAVARDGRESARSLPARFTDRDVGVARARAANAFTVSAPSVQAQPAGAAPAAPLQFRLQVDPDSALVTAAWEPVAGDIAGYRIYRTFVDPETHVGNYLEMDAQGGGDRFAFRKGDMLFITREARTFSKAWFSPRIFNAHEAEAPGFAPFYLVKSGGRDTQVMVPFELVPHEGALPPQIPDGGQTCMRFQPPEGQKTRIRRYNHADTTQDWYPVLDPGKTYIVEVLARQHGMLRPTLRFCLDGPLGGEVPPADFQMTDQWQSFRAEFTVPRRLTAKGVVGGMGLEVEGPGTVWIDNFRVYDKEEGLARWSTPDRAAFAASGMAALRTHDTCKTQGYRLADLLGHPLTGLSSGDRLIGRGNLAALLAEMRDMGTEPWLQIEFTLDEEEWRGLVEYYAAPYDPAVDTPAEKPWAWRRFSHGQAEPYTRVFSRLLLELGNENWNRIMPFNLSGCTLTDAATGEAYGYGQVYGLLQEYTIQVMKGSPYWTPEMEAATDFVIGGWAINDFGFDAARMSPSSKHVLVGDYNGGWDAREGPSSDRDAALAKTLIFGAQQSAPEAARRLERRDRFAAETGRRPELGTYEAGPGYNLDGLNNVRMTPDMVAFENQVMKSLAGGAATLDCFMIQAVHGAKLQNFFTFSRNRNYWSSHADLRNGGQAYPSWMALSMYNLHAVGDILDVRTVRTPLRHAPAVGRRREMAAAPEIAVYATRNGDRLAVIAISRRLEGFTPTTLILPVASARALHLHTLTGDPRAVNLEAEIIRPVSRQLPSGVLQREFTIDAERGTDNRGLPPASVFIYVFEGCTFDAVPPRTQ